MPLADRCEVRFRSAKGDQLRKGRVLTRVRTSPPAPVELGGGAVDVLVELLSVNQFLPPHAPLVAFGVGDDRWSLWSKHQATEALRRIVALVGLQPDEYALHSLRIGGATFLAAAGATPDLLRQEGRWAGERGYQPYVRSHGEDAGWVSEVLAAEQGVVLQPGQGTQWGVK